VIVVDNRPGDARTKRAVERVRRWRSADPLCGRAPSEELNGSKSGIPESTADILAFVDDDIEVDPNWLTWMVENFVADDQVGVVTGLVMPVCLDTPLSTLVRGIKRFWQGACDPKVRHGAESSR
jgi:hypothetical protein